MQIPLCRSGAYRFQSANVRMTNPGSVALGGSGSAPRSPQGPGRALPADRARHEALETAVKVVRRCTPAMGFNCMMRVQSQPQ
jgi:hypothetical protein